MPWATLSLKDVRVLVRGEISAALAGASYVGNSVLARHGGRDRGDGASRSYAISIGKRCSISRIPRRRNGSTGTAIFGSLTRTAHAAARSRRSRKGIISLSGTPGFIMPTGTQFQSAANLALRDDGGRRVWQRADYGADHRHRSWR